MRLKKLDIENFRGIKKLSLEFEALTVLIGENNTGKTSIMKALHTCLSHSLLRGSPFADFDYHLDSENAQPATAKPIMITLTFSESQEGEWPDEIVNHFDRAHIIQANQDNRYSIIFRVTSDYNQELPRWDFLDSNGNPLANEAKDTKYFTKLQQLVPVFYLATLRDAAQEFSPKSAFWGPFVKQLNLEDSKRQTLEQELVRLNQQVLDAHQGFQDIQQRLEEAGRLVPLAEQDPVSIEALPTRAFEMLSRTQVRLTSRTGARLPIAQHGEGTQSLSVMLLFDAFVQSRLRPPTVEQIEPILALEEPEAHLHPAAVKAMAVLLKEMNGQKLVTTHSGHLVADVDLFSLRRLCRKNGEIRVFQLPRNLLSDEEIRKLNYHVRATRGDLLFARCWLLIEGETEYLIFNECARILGYDLYAEGIFCVEYTHSGPEPLLKFANAMGIDWYFVADGDNAGQIYTGTANDYLNVCRPPDRHIFTLPDNGNIEVVLCQAGYVEVYENVKSPQKIQKNPITASQGSVDYYKQVVKVCPKKKKIPSAHEVVSKIQQRGSSGVPSLIKDIIDRSREIARQAG